MESCKKGKNVIGIIPVSGFQFSGPSDFPTHLTKLSEGCNAIQRSVYECTLAGCSSIWVVCNDDVSPLTKELVGDYVLDVEIFKHWDFIRNKEDHKEFIPIYYVPISQKDKGRRDSLGWSILHGALTSFIVSSKISAWASPSKYFVSFPYGIIDPTVLSEHRTRIRSKESFYVSHTGKTVKDNLYLPFTFNPEDWVIFKRQMKQQCTGGDLKIPAHERWSSKNFTLDKIFNCDTIDIDFVCEVSKYHEIDTWENYRNFCKSELEIPSVPKSVMKPFIIR